MTYAIRRDDPSVEAALRRLARAEAEAALAQALAPGDLGPRIQAMRRSARRLRALVRLVRPAFADARAEDAVLRAAARGLADLREAEVTCTTLARLARDLTPASRAALMSPVEAATRDLLAREAPRRLPAFAAAMASLRDRCEGWRLDADGWDALGPGLRATYAATREGLARARRDPAPDTLHAFRRRLREHRSHARLLAPIHPGPLGAHADAATALVRRLGELGDLVQLPGHLEALGLPAGLRAQAIDLAARSHAALLARAIPDGRRLLAERPRDLARRWGRLWALR